MTSSQDRQQALYDEIHDDYSRNLYDEWSMRYRDRFIHTPMFAGLDLNGKRFAELMCGDGPATDFARRQWPAVECHGYDISARACAAYSERTGFPADRCDIITTPLPAAGFDVIAVVGGLHHVVRDLAPVVRNIHQALTPGGMLVMMEPNRDYFLEWVRRIWYRFDKYFDETTEAALSYRAVRSRFDAEFEERCVAYGGGPAYFLVLMNMLFRIPGSWKSFYSPGLMQLERAWCAIPTAHAQAFFVAQWLKR